MIKLPRDKRSRILLAVVAAGTAGVAVVLWGMLIEPLSTISTAVAQQSRDAHSLVMAARRTVATTQEVATAFAVASERVHTAEETLPSGDLYVWMVQSMNQFKLAHDVEILQIGREARCEVGVFAKFPYQSVVYVVQGSAYYHDFGRFLAAFENQFPYMRVQNLQLEAGSNLKAEKAEDNERLRFKMEIVALVRTLSP